MTSAAIPNTGHSTLDVTTMATKQVWEHHRSAFLAKSIDDIMADYTADSVVATHDQVNRGLAEIHLFFDTFIKTTDPAFWDVFKTQSKVIAGPVAYLVWDAKPYVAMGTDTFVIRDNKILTQTITMFKKA